MKGLKRRLHASEAVNGTWLNLGHPLTAEMAGLAGFDWVLIDLEHGAGTETQLIGQLQGLSATPAAPVVRVESHDRRRIQRVLDMGAEGILVPRVCSAREAQEAVDAMHYPPHGSRGMAKMIRATAFASRFNEYFDNARQNILGAIQVETREILDELDAVAAIDGVDVLFIGPADLTMSLGIFGQFDHPLYTDAVQATVDAARRAGKQTGILIFNPDDYARYHGLGMRMVACGSDGSFVAEGARRMAAGLQERRQRQTQP
jgi:4-hydroxy-2-oxoheptanedioate aldolase